MSDLVAPQSNRLLAALSPDALAALLADYDTVDLIVPNVLERRGQTIDYVYFPFDGIVALVMPMGGDANLEVVLVGNEGMLGITVTLGVDVAPFLAVVNREGVALRIPRLVFMQELEKNPVLKRELKRYLYVLMSQLIQSSGCHRYHVLEKRLARLLLMIRDRAHSAGFYITQDLLARMLGVRRMGVTKAAVSLQHQQLISYNRGQMLIKDASGLERASCSCYLADKATYDRILTTRG